MKHVYRIQTGLLALLVLLASACGGEGGEGTTEDGAAAGGETVDAALVTQGQEIFTSTGICFTCHGQNAEGVTGLGPNLTDNQWLNIEEPVTVDKIMNLVRTGVPNPVESPAPMPPMGGAQLTDDQIRAVATYVYSLSHPAS